MIRVVSGSDSNSSGDGVLKSYEVKEPRQFTVITNKVIDFGSAIYRHVDFVQKAGKATGAFFKHLRRKEVLGGLSLAVILDLPENFRSIYLNTRKLLKKRAKELAFTEKAEFILRVAARVGQVFDNTATFFSGLAGVGAMTVSSIAFATPLMLAGVGLQGISLLLHAKSGFEAYGVLRELDKPTLLSSAVPNLKEFVRHLRSKKEEETSFIRRIFHTKGTPFLKTLERICDLSTNSENSELAERVSANVQNVMRMYLRRKMAHHAISGVAFAVSTVALGVLLGVPTAQPVGFGLLLLSGCISFLNSKFMEYQERMVSRELEKALSALTGSEKTG